MAEKIELMEVMQNPKKFFSKLIFFIPTYFVMICFFGIILDFSSKFKMII